MATIRGLTIELGATTTKLGTELNKIKSQASGISGELKTVDKLLKFESGDKTELLKRRLEAVNKAASEVKKEIDLYTKGLDANKKAVDAGEISQDQYEKNLSDLNKKLTDAKGRYEVLQAEIGDTSKKLDDANKGLNENAESLEDMGNAADDAGKKSISLGDIIKGNLISTAIIGGIKTLASAIASVAKAAFEGVKKIVSAGIDLVVSTGEWADALLENAEVTRLSTTELQKYEYALKFVDGDIDTLTKTMTRNIRSMGDVKQGNKELVASYNRLGIKVTDSTGQLRDSDEVYWEVIDALGKMSNETERDELAMTLLGKSAQELNPIINAGAEAFKALGDEAERIGYVMKPEDVEKFGLFNDMVDRLKSGLEGIKRQVAIAVMPFLDPIVKNVDDLLKDGKIQALADQYLPIIAQKMGEWGQSISDYFTSGEAKAFAAEWVPKVAQFVVDMINNLPGVVDSIGKICTKIGELIDWFGRLNYSLMTDDEKRSYALTEMEDYAEKLGLSHKQMTDSMNEMAETYGVEVDDILLNFYAYESGIKETMDNTKAHLDGGFAEQEAAFRTNQNSVAEYAESIGLSYDEAVTAIGKYAEANGLNVAEMLSDWEKYKDDSIAAMNLAATGLDDCLGEMSTSLDTGKENIKGKNNEIESSFSGMADKVGTETERAKTAMQAGIDGMGDVSTAKFTEKVSFIETLVGSLKNLWNSIWDNDSNSPTGWGSSPTGAGWGVGNRLQGRASGGSVYANSLYRVGENGPELFVPRVNGTIISAPQTQAIMDEASPAAQQIQQRQVPQEQIINLTVPQVVYLDGEVIYKNQQKIQQRKGTSLIIGGAIR